ncbi:MAG: alginate lyase family protein, partial [Phaeodactylibacter sp.]|nr:alginate lyase family protein [Phaeodactylibacter sp.]
MQRPALTLFFFCFLLLQVRSQDFPSQVILKLDDLWNEDQLVHPGWQQVVDFLNAEAVTGTIGVVCESLEAGSDAYYQWIKDREEEGFEIWHHGYCHCKPTVEGVEQREFRGTSLQDQREHLLLAQQLAAEKLQLTFRTFGAPYNSTDAQTAEALKALPDLKVWLYKETDAPTDKYVLERIPEVNIEYPVHVPDFEKFKAGFEKYRSEPVLIIQGHPRSWVAQPERFETFKKIIRYLKERQTTFTTPYTYYLEQSLVQPNRRAILDSAKRYLEYAPRPVTRYLCDRSAGGPHDFYSEGDYWWPDPNNPDGPYIRQDGQTNPDNFTAHRLAMRDLSRWVAALTSAYLISEEPRYAEQALVHLRAWFVDEQTRMNPHLLYAQAIKGRTTGRGIGIIDAIHLIEVARSIQLLQAAGALSVTDYSALQGWFGEFVEWLSTHPYGIAERDHGNNHSTWWAAQVAVFADLAGRTDLLASCRARFKLLLSTQMNEEGGFPDELQRTKPFNYSLFNLEAFSLLAWVASTPEDNLWTWESPNGSLYKAWQFMQPALTDRSAWPFPPDVEHFDELPIQSTGLLLAGLAYHDRYLLETWSLLLPERRSQEIDRTYPLRQPLLWLTRKTR